VRTSPHYLLFGGSSGLMGNATGCDDDACAAAAIAAAASPSSGSGMSKNCCGLSVTQAVSIRWFIVMIAFVGICCSVVGTVLGALKASGREHLTVSLLMIGNASQAR
jgi:hypothetical protein